MKLSLSVRIAEAPCKTKLNVPLGELIQLALENGYCALCMRASAGGVQTASEELAAMSKQIRDAGLSVSMVTADFDVPLNNEYGPSSLHNIGPSLDVAEALQCNLVRVCIKNESDIPHARNAADLAADRGIRLAHQCHTTTLFEQVNRSLEVLGEIDRSNFGIIYEPANLMLCGEPYGLSTLEKLKPHLMNVYLQNHAFTSEGPVELETWCRGVQRFRHLPIWDKGGVDFEEMMEALIRIGYEGFVTIHQAYAELMGPSQAAEESAGYLRSFGCFEGSFHSEAE